MIYSITPILGLVVFLTFCFLYYRSDNEFEKTKNKSADIKPTYLDLSYNEILDIIDTIFDEIVINKYELNYRLKEVTLIKNMEDDIREIATEVIDSLSYDFVRSIMAYISIDYLYAMIARKSKMYLMSYVAKNRPSSES